MPRVVGVAFKRVARSYWFDPGEFELNDMDRVVVDTTRGMEIGTVRVSPREVPAEELQAALKRVLRMAGHLGCGKGGGDKEEEREVKAPCKGRGRGRDGPP